MSERTIKIGIANGKFLTYPIEEGTSIQSVIDMYVDDTESDIGRYELRMDGTQIVNKSLDADGTMLIFSEIIKSNSDEGTTEEPAVKKKDIFTKDFCKNELPSAIIDALLEWAFEQKSKNKFLQAIRPFLMGAPAPIMINNKDYAVGITEVEGGGFIIKTIEETPTFLPPVSFPSLDGENKKDFLNRYNSIALESRR